MASFMAGCLARSAAGRIAPGALSADTHRTKEVRPSFVADRADLVDRQVRAVLLLLAQAGCPAAPSSAIDQQAAGESHRHPPAGCRAWLARLTRRAHPMPAGQRCRRQSRPRPAKTVQRPDTEVVVDLPAHLGRGERPDEQGPRHQAGSQRADRMHQVGTGAHRHQPGQRTVVQETGSLRPISSDAMVPPTIASKELTATSPLTPARVWALITLKPNQPMIRSTTPVPGTDARRRHRHQLAVAIAAVAAAQQQHRRQCQPAAQRMHHHGAGEIVEGRRTPASAIPASRNCRSTPSLENGYTKATINAVAHNCGPNLARSAMPPEMIAGIAAAKVSRKKNFTSA